MTKQMTNKEQAALSRIARQLGRRGGQVAAARMTPQERRRRAANAARKRWAKATGKETAHA